MEGQVRTTTGNNEGRSRTIEEGDKSGHQEKATQRRALTVCRVQRDKSGQQGQA